MECIELNDCVNIWKRSEAAKQLFLYWIEKNTVFLCEYRQRGSRQKEL